jgi:glycerol-3-phosphate dehydrogenase
MPSSDPADESPGVIAPLSQPFARRTEDLGHGFGYGFSERELDWLVKKEWALTGEDVLWRRSKLGLHLDSHATRAIVALLTGCRVAR